MMRQEDTATAKDLLDGLTTEQFRDYAVEALRRWRETAQPGAHFNIRDQFARQLVAILAERKRRQGVDAEAVKEAFKEQLGQPWMRPMIDFCAWLAGSGLAIPLYTEADINPIGYRLTTAGDRFLQATEDHPFRAGFADRVAKRCPGLPDDVLVLLADARACLDHGLLRPAVVLAGLAYETAENAVADHLDGHGKIQLRKNAKPFERIAAVRQVIPDLLAELDKRGAATLAWDFGDILRRERNSAAHSTASDFADAAAVHQLLISAAHHLPALWSAKV